MEDIFGLIFLVSLVASIYFFIRLVIKAVFGGETSGYRTKLVISLGALIISVALFSFIEMLIEENEADLKEEAQQRLEEILEQNFPSK